MSWLLAFLGFAVLIVLHEAGHFAAAKAVGMRVERFMLFFGNPIVSFRRGETEYGIGPIPLGGYVKISGMNPNEELPPEVAPRAYYRQKPWKRIVVILAGPLVNVLLAFVILLGLFSIKGAPEYTPVVRSIDGRGAVADVLRPGDRILSVDGVTGDVERLRAQIGTHRCAGEQRDGCRATTPAEVRFRRDGRTRTVSVRPRYTEATDPRDSRPLLGVAFGQEYVRQDVIAASGTSVDRMWAVTEATVSAVGRLFVSEEARKQVGGVVGGYEATRQTIDRDDWVVAIFILAMLSLSLAIVNLFPFLPLDGGHVFWAVAEKVRGRPIPFGVMERAGIVGFVLIIGLFVLGLTNDINRIADDNLLPR